MSSVKTPKGTELPLIKVKGKDYLQIAHRFVWLNEVVDSFTIDTEVLKQETDESVVRATVKIFDKDGKLVRSATATKREDSKGFPDHLEKCETSSIGRALAMLGFGTQFAQADLDEGNRLADAPLETPAKQEVKASSAPSKSNFTPKAKAPPKATKPAAEEPEAVEETSDEDIF